MKDSKDCFVTKMTLRLYDTDFINSLDRIYKASGERYESKNHFLTELLRRGLKDKQQETSFCNPNTPQLATTELSGMLGQIKTMLEDMHVSNKAQVDRLMAHLKISEKLSSAIYNLLLSIVSDEHISTKQLDEGFYDQMPDRLIAELKFLIDALSAKKV